MHYLPVVEGIRFIIIYCNSVMYLYKYIILEVSLVPGVRDNIITRKHALQYTPIL